MLIELTPKKADKKGNLTKELLKIDIVILAFP
jgi:hypothetical protein